MHNHRIPVTQKAQGIMAIQNNWSVFGVQGPGIPLMVIPGSLKAYDPSQITWPMFARPCPFRPRHGFVDSICVMSWEEVIRLLQSATDADPGNPVEIVLAPLLTGAVSAVATNAGITWGRGNDGVTAGKDPNALFIPVKTGKTAWMDAIDPVVCATPDFKFPEFPYLELVENDGDICLVQVRDGPEQPEGVNHVVRKMKVQHILKACASFELLGWEAMVRAGALQKGTVIWAPHMSLASHFCVHGIECGIPVITDHVVKVGDVIQPTKNRTSGLGKRDYAKIAALITKTVGGSMGLTNSIKQKNAVLTAVATTQAQFCWGRPAHLLRLRGLSVAVLLKAVLASCAGEIRHWYSDEGPKFGTPSLHKILPSVKNTRLLRAAVYKAVFNGSFTFLELKHALKAAMADLGHSDWERSFGGRRWAEVANTGVELAKAAERFQALPCAATWSLVVQKANRLINTSHNNGKCLTKWIETSAMLAISYSPTVGFLNPYVPLVALNLIDEGEQS